MSRWREARPYVRTRVPRRRNAGARSRWHTLSWWLVDIVVFSLALFGLVMLMTVLILWSAGIPPWHSGPF